MRATNLLLTLAVLFVGGCESCHREPPIIIRFEPIDAEELPEAEADPESPAAPRIIRPADLLAALGESPEVAAARAAGRAAVSRGEP